MKINEVIGYINTFANEKHQYPWDNTGLQVGDRNNEVTGILICVDSLSDVIDEAIEKNCNLIISHHPLLFSGVKRISDDYKSNIIKKLIKNDITVYSSHTAFDVSELGMNNFVADSLGLKNLSPLDDLSEMKCDFKVCVSLENAIKTGEIFSENGISCTLSHTYDGKAVYEGNAFKNIFGKISSKILRIDPSAEISAGDIFMTTSPTGLGIIGELPEKKTAEELIVRLKEIFECNTIKVSRNYKDKKIKTVAICTGSGGDYLKTAMRMGADMYICADLKWNDFLICEESGLTAVCPTHFESEKSFITILASKLKQFDSSVSIYESESENIETFL